jgi:hypothetical protein
VPVDQHAHGPGEIAVAVGYAAHLGYAPRLAPGVHDERVVDRQAEHLVDAVHPQCRGELVEARQVLFGTGGRERPRQGEQDHGAPGEKVVAREVGPVAITAHAEGDLGDALTFTDRGHGRFLVVRAVRVTTGSERRLVSGGQAAHDALE